MKNTWIYNQAVEEFQAVTTEVLPDEFLNQPVTLVQLSDSGRFWIRQNDGPNTGMRIWEWTVDRLLEVPWRNYRVSWFRNTYVDLPVLGELARVKAALAALLKQMPTGNALKYHVAQSEILAARQLVGES